MKTALIIGFLWLVLIQQSYGQDPQFVFQHQALAVSDVNQSADFYMKYFGLKEIVNRAQSQNIRWFSMGNGIELHLIQTNTEDLKLAKQIHMAFSTGSFDNFLNLLDQNEVSYTDWPGTKQHGGERLPGHGQEPPDVALVDAGRGPRPAVQPHGDELVVMLGLARRGDRRLGSGNREGGLHRQVLQSGVYLA